jgi:plasmid stability protein
LVKPSTLEIAEIFLWIQADVPSSPFDNFLSSFTFFERGACGPSPTAASAEGVQSIVGVDKPRGGTISVAIRFPGGAMPSLTLKNLPEELLAALRAAAARDRRSVTQEIIHLLDIALQGGQPPARDAADTEAQVAAWRKLAGKWTSDVDPATETKRIVERRTKGREVDL